MGLDGVLTTAFRSSFSWIADNLFSIYTESMHSKRKSINISKTNDIWEVTRITQKLRSRIANKNYETEISSIFILLIYQ